MGFMDGFTSDGTVDMKHTEYYNLMREATKAELIGNAVKADVPGFYIQAMITGKKPEFLNTLDAEEESTGFHAEYEQITGAVVTIFEAWMKENGVESTAASLHRLIDTLAQNRIEELRTIKVNQEEHREQIKAAFEEMEKTMGAMAKMPPITVRMDFGSKKDQAAAVEPKKSIYLAEEIPDKETSIIETLAHEYKHFMQDCLGQEFDENEAEQFANQVLKDMESEDTDHGND